ncbi:amidohydrolase family protein [Nitratifractor sp.]
MPKKNDRNEEHTHHAGCGCTPEFFMQMMEQAAQELSRREFLKGASLVGGALAMGAVGGLAQASENSASGDEADAIYFGGPILTMVDEKDRPEALAVKNGKILKVGSRKEVMASKGKATRLIDLKGRCLMPGFFDPHSHVVMQSAKFSVANLDPKPIGEAGSIADIQRILTKWIDEKKIQPGHWVIGWGYDDTGIEEQRHPTRDDLDKVSTEHPIVIIHISGHLLSGNSKMLEVAGISAETPDPEGGVIQRKADGKEPNGVLEELAMLLALSKVPAPTPEEAMEMLKKGLEFYARAGITTAQDCASTKGTIKLFETMAERGQLPIDVIAWPMYKGVDDALFQKTATSRNLHKRLKLGGVKLTVDGSIQGYTAYLSKPYYKRAKNILPHGDKCDGEMVEETLVTGEKSASNTPAIPKNTKADVGYPSMTQEQVDGWVKRCDAHNVPLQVHTNGDGATDMLLRAVERSRGKKPRPDLRTTIIHAQMMRDDQLDLAAKHGMTPSFFPIHVYFWGDRHRDLFLGPERAARLNPSRSALDRGLKITLHHDAPIAGIEMLSVADAAVNRITTGGKLLGEQERITPFEALRAITADAAWQNFEEKRKGTLEPGKLADLVILSDNPLTVDPKKIKEIKVLDTIKEGRSVYVAEMPSAV